MRSQSPPPPPSELLAPRPHLLHDGHCGNWASLRRRTLAGLPIRMLAYGSSIVGSGGGCTAAVPGICEASACPRCCGLSCTGETGWAREVFNEWNRSFPHAESDLLSIGQPGDVAEAREEDERALAVAALLVVHEHRDAALELLAELERLARHRKLEEDHVEAQSAHVVAQTRRERGSEPAARLTD